MAQSSCTAGTHTHTHTLSKVDGFQQAEERNTIGLFSSVNEVVLENITISSPIRMKKWWRGASGLGDWRTSPERQLADLENSPSLLILRRSVRRASRGARPRASSRSSAVFLLLWLKVSCPCQTQDPSVPSRFPQWNRRGNEILPQ